MKFLIFPFALLLIHAGSSFSEVVECDGGKISFDLDSPEALCRTSYLYGDTQFGACEYGISYLLRETFSERFPGLKSNTVVMSGWLETWRETKVTQSSTWDAVLIKKPFGYELYEGVFYSDETTAREGVVVHECTSSPSESVLVFDPLMEQF